VRATGFLVGALVAGGACSDRTAVVSEGSAGEAGATSDAEAGSSSGDPAEDTDGCAGSPGCPCELDADCSGEGWCLDGACKLPACGDEIEDPGEECDDDYFFEGCGCTPTCEWDCIEKECMPDQEIGCWAIGAGACGTAWCEDYLWDEGNCFDPAPIPNAGPPGPELEGCRVQCGGYLDQPGQEDVPDVGWADGCRVQGWGELVVVCGTPEEWRAVVLDHGVLDESGPADLPERIVDWMGWDANGWQPTSTDIQLLGAAFDAGATAIGGAGGCQDPLDVSLGIGTEGCAFEVTDCFGLGFDQDGHEKENAPRGLWLYLAE
jgi:hypothetical protein